MKEKAPALNRGAGREKQEGFWSRPYFPLLWLLKPHGASGWVCQGLMLAGRPRHCSGLWAWEGPLGVQSCFCGSRTRQAVGPHCPVSSLIARGVHVILGTPAESCRWYHPCQGAVKLRDHICLKNRAQCLSPRALGVALPARISASTLLLSSLARSAPHPDSGQNFVLPGFP